MKAETATGEIITLPKECSCATHNEPHWVHMDAFDKGQIKELINPDGIPPGLAQYIAEREIERLDEKAANMRRLGIVRLIREPSDDLSEVQRQGIQRRVAEMHPPPPPPAEAEPSLADKKLAAKRKSKELL